MRRGRAVVALVLACAAMAAFPAGARGQSNAPDSLWLLWTATGDDGDVGQAYRYDLRYSTSAVGSNITAWWNAARSAARVPVPSPSGQTDSTVVTGLLPETTYQFVIRVLDEVGNQSDFSNVASGMTPPEISPPPPGCQTPSGAPAQFQARADSDVVALTWAPASDPQATELHLWRATGASGPLSLLIVITDSGRTTYRDAGVNAGTTYRYRATWADTCGDGPASGSILVTLPSPRPQPAPAGVPSGATVHAFPNPSSGPVQMVIGVPVSSSQPVRIRLFDLSGHWVTDIADGSYPPGDTTITWPRTTRNGARVAPGYYEAIGFVGDTKVREQLVLLP